MMHKNSLVCATAALTLFTFLAACNSDGARTSRDTEAKRDDQVVATRLSDHPEAFDPSASQVPLAFRTFPADDEVPVRAIESPAVSTITSTNYIAIGTNIYTSLQSVNSYSGMPALCTPGARVPNGSTPNLTRQAVDLLLFAIAGKPSVVHANAHTLNCNSGGTMEVDATLQQADRVSRGDRIALSLSACQLTSNTLPASGKAVFSFSQMDGAVSGDKPWHAAVDVQLQELTVALSRNAVVGNGTMSVEIRQASEGHRIVSVRSARLSEKVRSGSAARIQFAPAARTYRDYRAVGTNAGTSSAWNLNYDLTTRNGYFYTSEFVVSTLQAMVFSGGSYPVSGEVKVTGKNSSLTLTALEGDMVRLDFSEHGDDVITETTRLPSGKLLAAIE